MNLPTSVSQKKIPITDLSHQYNEIKDELDVVLKEIFTTSSFILGKNVKTLEEELAAYTNCKHVISCANGTDAIQLALMALGIGSGDEVITVSHSFFATASAIFLTGAKPVFVDISETDFNIDVSKIESAITTKTKAIIPVHIYGQLADMESIISIAKKHKLAVIEDTAQSLGARSNNKFAGTFGDIGTFSFFPTKNFGAFGDGGAMCTNDDKLAERLRQIRVHGSPGRYIHDHLGMNSRLDEIQAAVLRIKLKHLDKWNKMRVNAAKNYTELLSDCPSVICPSFKDDLSHIFHQYTIRINNRDSVQSKLEELGVQSIIYYPIPIHKQKATTDLGVIANLPVTEKLSKEIISLPMYADILPETQEYIVKSIKSIVK